jgi:hypothetical protein
MVLPNARENSSMNVHTSAGMSSTRSRSGGIGDWKDVQAIEQVFAKRLVPHRVLEIAVRRRDDPDVNLDRLGAAKTLDHAFLQHAEQLDLYFHRQVADLVEEERRLVSRFEAANLPRQRAGVGPTLAPEQLAFDQGSRDGGAADADHLALMTRAEVVNRLRHHFLPVPVSPSSSTVAGVGATCSI